jgi:micrococcal nuclease
MSWIHRSIGMFLAALALSAIACSSAEAPPGDSARVVQVRDGDTIVVEVAGRKEDVRLLGVDTPEMNYKTGEPEPFALEATLFTRETVDGTSVVLTRDGLNQDRDHYDRLLRYVHLKSGDLLNVELIRLGYGFAFLEFPLTSRERLVDAEIEARNTERGLWAPNRVQDIPFSQASRFEGRVVAAHGVIVAARTVNTKTAGRICFLNFHEDYKRHLSVVIREEDFSRFGGDPSERYRGKTVTVTGRVRDRRGRLQIQAVDPGQIESGG